jgi:hypothetical protein
VAKDGKIFLIFLRQGASNRKFYFDKL